MKIIEVICPNCKKKFNYFSSEFRPFCTERCRLIDLGQWLNEAYTVPVSKLTEEEAQTLDLLTQNKDDEDKNEN